MKKLLLAALFASSSASAGVGSGTGKITELYTNASGSIARIQFSAAIKNPDNCGKSTFYMVELNDSAGSNRFYSTLLAAHAAQKDVSFWVHGCTNGTYWGGTQPKITDIYFKQ